MTVRSPHSNPLVNQQPRPKGPEAAVEYRGGLSLTFWDLWCLLAAQKTTDSDLGALRALLVKTRFESFLSSEYERDLAEDLIFLISDLATRLEGLGSCDELLAAIPEPFRKRELSRATKCVLGLTNTHAPSEVMLRSPRRTLRQEAFRGSWPLLPVNPAPFADTFARILTPNPKKGFIPKGETSALALRLREALQSALVAQSDKEKQGAFRYSVCRAFLTVYHEKHCWDDSYGIVSDLGASCVKDLLNETPLSTGIDAEIFLKDLLMFLVWEIYGLSRSGQVALYIQKRLSSLERALTVKLLKGIHKRAHAGYQEYHADQAKRILQEIGSSQMEPLCPRPRPRHLRLVEASDAQ